ncbi:MAG: T9SS type A sorting domain-containing protein, partial [Cyclobacteriaceae bacterium]
VMILTAFLLPAFQLSGQTGPGGVSKTDGLSELILWLDANQIDDVASGNTVGTWSDVSGYNHNVTSATVNGRPNYLVNQINGFPSLNFSGNGEFLAGEIDLDAVPNFIDGDLLGLSAPFTVIAVAVFDVDQGSDNDYVFSLGDGSDDSEMSAIARRNGSGSEQNRLYSWDGNSAIVSSSATLATSATHIIRQMQNTSSTFLEFFLNGSPVAMSADNASITTSGKFEIGDFSNSGPNTNVIDGLIPEVIVYDRALNEAETSIIESYLAAKYDVAVSNDKYSGDDADPLGGGSDGEFDFDVSGIGTESGLSNVTASSKGMTISQKSNFGNSDYVLLGHKLTTNTIIASDINDSDVTNDLDERWQRVWYLDVTDGGGALTIDVQFDFSQSDLGHFPSGPASNYKLLNRSNNTSGTNWDFLASGTSISGSIVTFEDVTPSDGYYAIGTIDNTASSMGTTGASLSSNGPGGIGNTDGLSSLELWLDAASIGGTDGEPITRWSDLSGNLGDALATNAFRTPKYRTAVASINSREVLRFDEDGDDDTQYVNSQSMGGTLGGTMSANPGISVIAVASFRETQGNEDNDYIIGIGTSGTINQYVSLGRRKDNDAPAHTNELYSWYGVDPPRYGPVVSNNTWNIYVTQHGVGPTHNLYIDGTLTSIDNYSADVSVSSTYHLSRWNTNESNHLDGDIAEVIVFSEDLNTAKRIILQNYLSGKYDIALDVSVEKYNGDTNGNGDNDFDISGIGSESGTHTSGSSAGIEVSSNSGLDDGDYLIFGHKTATNTVNKSDVSGSITRRWDRAWWFDVTDPGSDLTLDVTFDISEGESATFPDGVASNYKIIFSATGSSPWSVVGSSSSVANDQIFFTNISTASGDGYYTLGTIDESDSPLPVELIFFDHKQENETVTLHWKTAAEINNDHFDIMRSSDGRKFMKIGKVGGSGNTSQDVSYSFNDANPFPGPNYYKLNQVDFDGSYEESYTIVAFFEPKEDIVVYPIPVKGELNIDLGSRFFATKSLISILDLSGREIKSIHHDGSRRQAEMSVHDVQGGLYIIRVQNDFFKSEQRLLIQRH